MPATFTTTGISVTVGATPQVSGTTANDFTNPVVYTVTAADGSTQDYTVTVGVLLDFVQPIDITLNSTGTIAYVTNYGNNTITQCSVNGTISALSGCTDSGGTGFNAPAGISLNSTGAIAYVTNGSNSKVSQCNVNGTTGALSGCTTTNGAN